MKTKKIKQTFEYKETSCSITTDRKRAIKAAVSSIKCHRNQLEKYVRHHPRFLYSLQPVEVKAGPTVVELMAEAAGKANVGPMAAVAGVLADLAVEEMISTGAELAVVENGGEASAFSNGPIDVALSAGDSPLSGQIGFRLESSPLGVATSSGLFSHAFSYGEAEAVTIFAMNAGLADASATAIGNLILGDNCREVVKNGLNKALSIQGVMGAFILYRGIVGKAGEIPRIIRISHR